MTDDLSSWASPAWRLISQIDTLLGLAMGISWFGAIILLLLKRETIRRWLTRNRFPDVGSELEPEKRWDAIAFTVCRKELPLWVMEFCRPARIGLIAPESSQATAMEIASVARSNGIDVEVQVYLESAEDPGEAMSQTRLVLNRLRDAGAVRIGLDITNGKTPMILGAFMAAEEMGISSLCVSAEFDIHGNKPDLHTARIHCVSRPAQGHR